ncbi:MAG: hypothetical protein NC254_10290 [bacterium]|nr:hypothetical protein [bacterium]
MGYLWENMEKMDIQLERRNTAEQRQRAEEAEKRAEEAEEKAKQSERNLSRLLIANYRQQGMDRKTVRQRLIADAGMDACTADNLLEMFWKT